MVYTMHKVSDLVEMLELFQLLQKMLVGDDYYGWADYWGTWMIHTAVEHLTPYNILGTEMMALPLVLVQQQVVN